MVSALLRQRGASEAELREHSEAIDSLRSQLATLVREGGGAHSAAARGPTRIAGDRLPAGL